MWERADLFLPVVLRSNCGSELARDGGLTAGQDFVDRVHIHCCGNGGLGFRPDGGSLFSDAKKVTKKALPHHSVPRLGSACPLSGIAPWARREGPSMAQRGYPGIHAGLPTPQCLRSAIVVNGASRSKAKARRPDSRPGSCGRTPFRSVGAKLARDEARPGDTRWLGKKKPAGLTVRAFA